jgi:hypothetical protein
MKKRQADGCQSHQLDVESGGRNAVTDNKLKSSKSNNIIVVASLLMALSLYALLLRMLLYTSVRDKALDPFNYRQNIRNPDYLSHSLESIMLEGLPNRRRNDEANATFDMLL